MRMDRNAEGYADPTPGEAYKNIRRAEQAAESECLSKINSLIHVLKATAALAGFDIIGRISLRDRKTGKEYK
jgi:hypothetical protein